MVAPTVPGPRICIVSPAAAAANNGNWHTAARWQRFLAPVATVRIQGPADDFGEDDLLIALHARRSAEAVQRWRDDRPAAPLALVLTGTDLYRDLDHDTGARHSLEFASRVVVLQQEGLARLDAATRAKAVVIVQSASAVRATRSPDDPDFVAVGHLRAEKDPETLIRAARLLAVDGRAPTIAHIGAALDERLGDAARAAGVACPAYRWLGGLSHAAARQAIARAQALVHPSVMEGGANVVVEAVRSGVPVLASQIDGNVGLLGADYDGFFAVGDAAALAALMRRFVADAAFAAQPEGAMRGARAAVPAGARTAFGAGAGLRPAARGVAGALRQSASASGPTL